MASSSRSLKSVTRRLMPLLLLGVGGICEPTSSHLPRRTDISLFAQVAHRGVGRRCMDASLFRYLSNDPIFLVATEHDLKNSLGVSLDRLGDDLRLFLAPLVPLGWLRAVLRSRGRVKHLVDHRDIRLDEGEALL